MTQIQFDKAYVDQFLTNMSLAYLTQDTSFVADKLFPTVKVVKDSALLANYGKQGLRLVEDERATGWKYNEVKYTVEKTNAYLLKDHGLSTDVYLEETENADAPIDAEVDKTKLMLNQLRLAKEARVLNLLTASTITNNLQLSSSSDKFSSYATSNPFQVIETAINTMRWKCGRRANKMLMSYDVYSMLKNHPDLLARFPWKDIITASNIEDVMASLFGKMTLLVADAQVNDANLWGTDSLADLLTKKIFLCYSEDTPTLMSTSFGKKFTKSGEDFQVAKYPVSMLGKDAIRSKVYSMIMANQKYDNVITDIDAGYLIYDVIA